MTSNSSFCVMFCFLNSQILRRRWDLQEQHTFLIMAPPVSLPGSCCIKTTMTFTCLNICMNAYYMNACVTVVNTSFEGHLERWRRFFCGWLVTLLGCGLGSSFEILLEDILGLYMVLYNHYTVYKSKTGTATYFIKDLALLIGLIFRVSISSIFMVSQP